MTLGRLDEPAAYDGEVVHLVGIYCVTSTKPYPNIRRGPDGKITRTFLIARLQLEDGTMVMLGIRPDAELAELDDKVVVAVGTIQVSPPEIPGMAQMLPTPTLRRIESITPRLADDLAG